MQLRALSHIRVLAHLWPIIFKLGSGLLAMTIRVTRPLLAGDSKVYILNIRPQIDLSQLVSIFSSADRKNLLLTIHVKAITRSDVILWTPDNPP